MTLLTYLIHIKHIQKLVFYPTIRITYPSLRAFHKYFWPHIGHHFWDTIWKFTLNFCIHPYHYYGMVGVSKHFVTDIWANYPKIRENFQIPLSPCHVIIHSSMHSTVWGGIVFEEEFLHKYLFYQPAFSQVHFWPQAIGPYLPSLLNSDTFNPISTRGADSVFSLLLAPQIFSPSSIPAF